MIFRNWVLQNFPFLEDDFDALTDYELFCKMVEYMKKSLDKLKEYQAEINIFSSKLDEFQHYFDNLDVTAEVNAKLDEMVEDGTMEELIAQYLQLQTTYTYNSVAEMKLAENLANGAFTRTSGYYSYNDGGGAYYKIRTVTNDDVIDDMFIIALYDNTLVAELLYQNEINILQLGAKVNDDDFNSTDIIQEAIDKLEDKNNGKVYLPAGNLYVDDTITLKSNVGLIGSANSSTWSANADINLNTDTVINFVPESAKTLFVLDTDNKSYGYCTNYCLENIYLLNPDSTSTYCDYAIYLDSPAKSIFKNLNIVGFNTNIYIKKSMEVEFNQVYSIGAKTSCLYVDNNIVDGNPVYSTTTYFNECYFGQTIYYIDSNYGGGNPLTIKVNAIENFSFINCIFESSPNSIEIDGGNSVNFNNIYVENIPSSGTNPTFKIGEHQGLTQSITNLYGGIIIGKISDSPETNSVIFNVNYANNLNINGLSLQRSDKVIKASSNTGLINYVNCIEESINNSFKANLVADSLKDKAVWINSKNDSHAFEKYYLPKQTLPFTALSTFANDWSAYQYGVQYYRFGNLVLFEFNAQCGANTVFSKVMDIPDEIKPTQPVFMRLRDRSDLDDASCLVIDPASSQLQITSNATLTVGHVYQASIIYWIY